MSTKTSTSASARIVTVTLNPAIDMTVGLDHLERGRVNLGRSVTQHKQVSDVTAHVIDEEVRSFVEAGEATARKIIEDHRDQLEIIAQGLLEHETLSRDEIEALQESPLSLMPERLLEQLSPQELRDLFAFLRGQ